MTKNPHAPYNHKTNTLFYVYVYKHLEFTVKALHALMIVILKSLQTPLRVKNSQREMFLSKKYALIN